MLAKRVLLSRAGVQRHLSMMVATEAMPVDATLSPKAAAPAQIKSSKLANGIRIVSRDGGAGSVSMSFAVMCGSSAESLNEQGSAKLLSMAAFGGSADKSGLRICRDLENAGASFCAASDRQKITYSVSCLADNAEEVFGVVANAIAHPIEANRYYVLDEDAKEKAAIVAAARGADVRAQVSDLLMEAAYGENTAFGKPEHAPTLKSISAESILAFRAAHFTTGNLVVTACGLPHDVLKSLTECHFHGMAEGGAKQLTGAAYSGGDMKVRVDLGGETHMGLGFPAADASACALLVAKLEAKLAAHGFKKGAVSTFHANGIFGVYASGDAAAATAALSAATTELKALAANADITDGDKAKATLANFLRLESGAASAALLDATLAGVAPETAADLRKVSSADVSAAAKAALGAVPAFAVYGATAGTPSFATVAKMMK